MFQRLMTLSILFMALQATSQEVYIDAIGLQSLLDEVRIESEKKELRKQKYLKELSETDREAILSSTTQVLDDVLNGIPQYIGIDNDDAGEAIGVPALSEGGNLGLNITGEDIEVGIWDGGIIRTTHQEIVGRVKYFDAAPSSQLSDHATGVATTLIGSGINDRARGMAAGAIGVAYDFISDDEEMILAQMQKGLILSNHSYGPVTGWDGNNNWLGDPSISDREDWRFGFYDGNARSWDGIAYNAPYYLIVKSAGNDRGNSGTNGTFPADGPNDCIAGSGVSKNIMTVGAVRKSNDGYDAASKIEMSSFSGWGPVDDGRIKPDLVAVGVSVFTGGSADDENYQTTQGTSFSSPSACGGLVLLQDLYRRQYNQYMKSATLKGLAIQTTKEAGNFNGPDYRFGWGLLDIESAAQQILFQDGENYQIIEDTLFDGQEYVIELTPKSGTSIKSTLSWTDVPGSPVSPSLDPTDLMLVNDLDMRIEDETGEAFEPWIMDPANPSLGAKRGDNFRDNVEQIFTSNVEPRKYFLRIRHKGSLENGAQPFSLILKYESEINSLTNLYWIGDSGNWSTGNNWSNNSGGSGVSSTPNSDNKLIFDDNSVSGDNNVISIDRDFEIGSIFSFTDKEIIFDLQGNTITCSGSILLSSSSFTMKNGTIILENTQGADNLNFNLDDVQTENLEVILSSENTGVWSVLNSAFNLQSLTVQSGAINIENSQLDIEEIRIGSGTSMQLSNSHLRNVQSFMLLGNDVYKDDVNSSITNAQNVNSDYVLSNNTILGTISLSNGTASLEANNASIANLNLTNQEVSLNSNLDVDNLSMTNGSSLMISNGQTVQINQDLNMEGSSSDPIAIVADGAATIRLEQRSKYCFSDVMVSNTALEGFGAVSIDGNSSADNSSGWFVGSCEDLLFADFEGNYLCTKALSLFEDRSDGRINSHEWFVDQEFISDGSPFYYTFPSPGTYNVKLVVKDDSNNSSTWEQNIMVTETEIDSNYIVSNATQLASFKLADSYQWYKNDQPIEGETGRILIHNNEMAKFCVVTFEGGCNRKSSVLDLGTSTIDIDRDENPYGLSIDPNPASDILNIRVQVRVPSMVFKIYNIVGEEMISRTIRQLHNAEEINVTHLPSGMYHCLMKIDSKVFSKRILIE